MTENPSRNRFIYAGLTACIIALGLASRRWPVFPAGLNAYVGDALWALMMFCLFGILFPRLASARLAALALAVAVSVELSQLYQAPWINGLRQTRLGGLILGHGFLWGDLVSYGLGVAAGFGAERIFRRDVAGSRT